jgi:hypothetical protein
VKKLIFVLFTMLLLSCTPVFAANYIVTIDDIDEAEGYELEPLLPDAGLYLTDEATAELLYSNGIAVSIEEDAPLVIPEPTDDSVTNSDNSVLNAYSAYNDTYYKEEVYFDQLKINEYIDTYNPSGDVRIAVIDTGVNKNHAEFANTKFETGKNYVTGSTDTTDSYGHGTLVTSIIAAGANNGIGLTGISPNSTIVPLVVMSKVNGQTVSSVSYLIKAMVDAVDTYDCDIINISMGITEGDSVLNSAAQYAIKKGAIVISSAGNSGEDSDSSVASALSYPASSEGVISVGATDSAYNRATYSQKNEQVDVVAYGGSLHLASNTSNSTYLYAKGTSFSAPVITGITALFISNHKVSPADYSRILKAAAVDIGELGKGDYMGYGMPDCMAMEDVYTYNADVYISNLYEKSDGTVNVKVASSGSVDTAKLVVASFKDGCMDSYTLYDLSFTDDFAYVSLPSMPKSGTRMFVINNLSGLESLSEVVEY